MFKFLRPAMPAKTANAKLNPISYEDGATVLEFNYASTENWMTHTIPNKTSMFNPPLHIHLNQDEAFEVVSGQGTWYMPRHANKALREAQLSASADTPAGREVVVPAGEYHRFENSTADTPLVVRVGLREPDLVMEEKFFRNFFGYVDDCRKAQVQPSVFQMMRFLWEFECPLGVPLPGPNWVAVGVSKAVCFATGVVVGEWLLGYKGTYPEYYSLKAE